LIDDPQILDTLLAFFAALVSRDPVSLTDLAQRMPPSFSPVSLTPSTSKLEQKLKIHLLVNTLFALLGDAVDPLAFASTSSKQEKNENNLELRSLGIGKKDQGLVGSPDCPVHRTPLKLSDEVYHNPQNNRLFFVVSSRHTCRLLHFPWPLNSHLAADI
jgi:hypothetical protein